MYCLLLSRIYLGTHLYVLYEGYGYSVAYLYCLGFATGGLLSPITGPLVDKIGRKKSAILYCCLEMLINYMEQFPYLTGLIVCRMIGGFTTNLLSSVFETWLDTEYRRRGFAKEKYEIIMRDSVIVSNMAAILSGYLSHILANRYGTVGPFQGAVTCTTIALMVVSSVWTENYGVSNTDGSTKNMMGYFREAVNAFRNDRRMLIVGLLQSLTAGSIQIFVFLWAPTLRHFATSAPKGIWGLDQFGEPAYGLIFCAFMGAGVLGGLVAPRIRTFVSTILSPIVDEDAPIATVEIEGEGNVPIRPMAVEFLASFCYFISALLLFVPSLCQDGNEFSFTNALVALLLYEFLIGIFMPCEGVIRSLYFPTSARASIMTLPRIFVNIAVAIGVVSTNFIR
jgi:MFS transporter, MFS domain-containing protein family, molybdate-anion transporter